MKGVSSRFHARRACGGQTGVVTAAVLCPAVWEEITAVLVMVPWAQGWTTPATRSVAVAPGARVPKESRPCQGRQVIPPSRE